MKVKEFLTLITRKLETMAEGGDRTLADCFSISTVCTSFSNQREEITEGLEQLTVAFAERFYRTLHYLIVTDPTSRVLENVHQYYDKVFPRHINFTGFPSRHTIAMIDTLARVHSSRRQAIWKDDDRPSDGEHIRFARDIAERAQAEYQREHIVPESILNFALDSMFLDPLPPVLIIVDCLKVIAIALGCDVPDVAAYDERYVCLSFIDTHLLTTPSVRVEVVLNLITRSLETMVGADQGTITYEHCEAVCALTPYAIFLEENGQQDMANAIMQVVRGSKNHYFMFSARPHITTLLGKPNSSFRNWLIALAAPHVDWKDEERVGDTVVAWAAAVSTVPDTEEVIQSVVGTLMQITNIDSLRPHIPIETWVWTKKLQSLPVEDWPHNFITTPDTIRHVRGLGDFDIIGSYFLAMLVSYQSSGNILSEVETSIREDFGGIGMWGHREVLLNRVDSALEGVDFYDERLKRCIKLKGVLLDMDREAMKTLARKFLGLISFNNHPHLHERTQDLVPPSCALCPFIPCDRSGWLVFGSIPSSSPLYHDPSRSIYPFPSCPFRTVTRSCVDVARTIVAVFRCVDRFLEPFFFPFGLRWPVFIETTQGFRINVLPTP